MSSSPNDHREEAVAKDAGDPLLGALRELPSLAVVGSAAEARLHRQARASYVRSFERSTWALSAGGVVGRAAVPVVLAGVVGVYLTWAIATAAALVQ